MQQFMHLYDEKWLQDLEHVKAQIDHELYELQAKLDAESAWLREHTPTWNQTVQCFGSWPHRLSTSWYAASASGTHVRTCVPDVQDPEPLAFVKHTNPAAYADLKRRYPLFKVAIEAACLPDAPGR